MGNKVYLDYAATSWPKPEGVVLAVMESIVSSMGNPGRSGYESALDISRKIYEAREGIASLVNSSDPLNVIFGANATWGLNLLIRGFLKPGDHVLVSSLEHNSVMRPLNELAKFGISYSIVQASMDGYITPVDYLKQSRSNTILWIINGVSNVVGTIQPVYETAALARKSGVKILVDGAQLLGSVPFDMQESGVDFLAFTGHKGLLGPQGTGGLIFLNADDAERVNPFVCGGTGSLSEKEIQPEFLPDKFESGTANGPGLAGLAAALDYINNVGVEKIRKKELALIERLYAGLAQMEGLAILGNEDFSNRTGILSFNFNKVDSAVATDSLWNDYGVMCRVGLHCAPAAHKSIGTFPNGTIRLSVGYATTDDDIDYAINSVKEISKRKA